MARWRVPPRPQSDRSGGHLLSTGVVAPRRGDLRKRPIFSGVGSFCSAVLPYAASVSRYVASVLRYVVAVLTNFADVLTNLAAVSTNFADLVRYGATVSRYGVDPERYGGDPLLRIDAVTVAPGPRDWDGGESVPVDHAGLNPARSKPRCTAALRDIVRQTTPSRRLAAMSAVMPTSMPTTSGFTQPLCGFHASTKP